MPGRPGKLRKKEAVKRPQQERMSTKGRVINKGRTIKYRQRKWQNLCLAHSKRSRGRPPQHLVHLRTRKEVKKKTTGAFQCICGTYKRCKRKTTYCTATPNASATPQRVQEEDQPQQPSAPPTCPSPLITMLEWPGMSSCKIFSTGTTKVTKSADVTGDIGYKPSTAPKLKWNGKAAISTGKLQEMREEQRKKSKGSSSNNLI
ncbi:hypothetical protein H5410_017292 [Solanum commersonii]|uniref:Uncharacterized protein n=1 Tax=Solanum commersonii TaxID=4109 RepID=A0A9J5ZZX6_SOLCO|nr:hypothetical protein H5410_017292 [Solanum commersonii]